MRNRAPVLTPFPTFLQDTMNHLVLCTLFLGLAFNQGFAHQFRFSSCPRGVKPMENFQPERMNGEWFIIKKLATSSSCMKAKFGVDGPNTFTIQESRAVWATDMTPVDISITNVGKLTMDPNTKSKMTLQWHGNFMSNMVQTSYIILDTDYDNFALDFEFQSLALFCRVSATIYGRTNSLSQVIIDRLEAKLESLVDLSRMNAIDHSNCRAPEDNNFNLVINENGLSTLGILADTEFGNLETEAQVREYVYERIDPEA